MAKRPLDMRKFTPFGGDAMLFRITESAAPELYMLSQKFPNAVSRALKSLGWYVQKSMKEMVRQGGPAHDRWLELSDMRRYRRMDRLKAGEFPRKAQNSKSKSDMTKKWTGSPQDTVFGKVAQTLAYRKPKDQQMVEIGALSPSAAKFLAAVQEGKRGSKGGFQFSGRQTVTPAMRRAFWAAGMPISKETTVIGQEERPLVPPVFKEIHPEIERYLVRKITETLAKQGIDWVNA